jgi:hypothetical protein
MILSTKFALRIADFYFDEPEAPVRVDVIRFIQTGQPVPGTRCKIFHTIVNDLREDEEALLQKLRKVTRQQIARAKTNDRFEYEHWDHPDNKLLDHYCEFFDRFAALKGQPRASRSRLHVLRSAGALDLSVVRHPGGDLVWHAHHRAGDVVRLLASASLRPESDDREYRNRVGRANRYHHWLDMLRFKAQQRAVYDFGGFTSDCEDPELAGINMFKSSFGGQVVQKYLCQRAVTWRGKLALNVLDRLRRPK